MEYKEKPKRKYIPFHPGKIKISSCVDCGKELKRKDAKRCTFCSLDDFSRKHKKEIR